MPSHRSALPVLVLLALGLLSVVPPPARAQEPELLADIAEGGGFASNPHAFQSLGAKTVYLDTGTDSRPTTLWVTDGKTTEALGYLCPPCGWGARALGVANGIAYYASTEVYAELGETTYLWRTDGTPAGTFPVTGPLRAPQGACRSSPRPATPGSTSPRARRSWGASCGRATAPARVPDRWTSLPAPPAPSCASW